MIKTIKMKKFTDVEMIRLLADVEPEEMATIIENTPISLSMVNEDIQDFLNDNFGNLHPKIEKLAAECGYSYCTQCGEFS